MSQSDLARQSSLQQSYISRLENENRSERVDVARLQRIAAALQVTMEEILIQARIIPSEDRRGDLRWKQMERIFRSLPEDRQHELVAIAKTLRDLPQSLQPRVIGQTPPQDAQGQEPHQEAEDVDA
jgi:transcriptional regulator with XRE-family HTH domain